MATKKKRIENAIEEAKEIEYDKDGNAVIEVGLTCKEDFYNPYSVGSYKTLNEGMTTFIEDSIKKIPPTETLSLKIYTSSKISKIEKEEMKKAINREYAEKYVLLTKKLNLNLLTTLILAIVGLGVLSLAILFENLKWSSILSNTIMIVAWVFLWEAVEYFFFYRSEIRHKKRIVKKILHCEIYIEENKSG